MRLSVPGRLGLSTGKRDLHPGKRIVRGRSDRQIEKRLLAEVFHHRSSGKCALRGGQPEKKSGEK